MLIFENPSVEIDQTDLKLVSLNNIMLSWYTKPGLILGLRSANETRRYIVMTSLTGWAQD